MLTKTVEKVLAGVLEQVAPGAGASAKVGPAAKPEFGDFAFAAMPLARPLKRKPLEIAGDIAARLRETGLFAKVEVAPPGYVNLTMADAFWTEQLSHILAAGESFGRSDAGAGKK